MATPNDIPKARRRAEARADAQKIENARASVKDVKKPFVRKPYLTQRPLKNDPRLMNLKKGLQG